MATLQEQLTQVTGTILPVLVNKLNDLEARIAELKEYQDSECEALRTRIAELEAAPPKKLAAKRGPKKKEAEPAAPDVLPGEMPVVIRGMSITGIVIRAVTNAVIAGKTELQDISQYTGLPEEVIQHVLRMSADEQIETANKFPE